MPLEKATYQVELFGVYTGIKIRVYRTDSIVEQAEHNEAKREQVGLGRCTLIELTFDSGKVKVWLCYFGKLIGERNGLDRFL